MTIQILFMSTLLKPAYHSSSNLIRIANSCFCLFVENLFSTFHKPTVGDNLSHQGHFKIDLRAKLDHSVRVFNFVALLSETSIYKKLILKHLFLVL